MGLPENKNYKQADESQLPVKSGSGTGIMKWDFYILFYTFSFKWLFPCAHFTLDNKNHVHAPHRSPRPCSPPGTPPAACTPSASQSEQEEALLSGAEGQPPQGLLGNRRRPPRGSAASSYHPECLLHTTFAKVRLELGHKEGALIRLLRSPSFLFHCTSGWDSDVVPLPFPACVLPSLSGHSSPCSLASMVGGVGKGKQPPQKKCPVVSQGFSRLHVINSLDKVHQDTSHFSTAGSSGERRREGQWIPGWHE